MIQSALQFIPQEKHGQKQDILDYLARHGSITRMESFDQLGICELPARICELESQGYFFPKGWVKGRAKNGRAWAVRKYFAPTKVPENGSGKAT
jgi:hypothetical protein